MKNTPTVFRLIAILLLTGMNQLAAQMANYPKVKKHAQLTELHNIHIKDAYQWMEDLNDPELHAWMSSQDDYLHQLLDESSLELIKSGINWFGQTGKGYSVPRKGGDLYYYNITDPALRHSLLCRKKGLEGEPEILLNMNDELEEGQTYGGFSLSPSGKTLVCWMRTGQNRYGQLHVFDLQKGQWREVLDGTTSANIAWTKDGGFYYNYYGPSAQLNSRAFAPQPVVKFHRIGSDPQSDISIKKRPEGSNMIFRIASAHDEEQVVISTLDGRSDRNAVFIVDKTQKVIPLVPHDEYMLNYVGSKGDAFYFYSNQNAPNGKIIRIDKNAPEEDNWKTIIPEMKETLAGGSTAGGNAMNLIGDHFTLLYREGTQNMIRIFDIKGEKKHEIKLETGWIGSGLVGKPTGREVWFSLNTFLSPSNIYRIDLRTGEMQQYFDRNLPIDRNDYTTRNTYYTSFDSTKVPIYICHKKALKMDGQNPVFMYGYGFGGWVATPWYQPHLLTFLEMGGIYVLPGVRGGGEFGDAWKDAGILLNRQNAIDDYIAASEFLIGEGYTSAGRMIANGWSASGSLAAAVTMQRPDLYGAAMIGIPSLDMVRYEQFTAFKGWTRGYGSVADQEEFMNLWSWSPYHNIKSNTCYPPMIVTVGEKDQTTPPQHGYKFVAAMQEHQSDCDGQVVLKIVWGGGHGFGTDAEQRLVTQSQEMTFLSKVLDLDVNQLKPISQKGDY